MHTRQTDGRTDRRASKTCIPVDGPIIIDYLLEMMAVDKYFFVAVVSAHL